MPDIGLRPSTPEDRSFLRALYVSTRDDLSRLDLTDDLLVTILDHQFSGHDAAIRSVEGRLEDRIVTLAGADIGRIAVAHRPGSAHLADLALLPEHRSAGIGTRLLADLVADADRRMTTITANVAVDNPALRWYRRAGFVDSDVGPVYVSLRRSPRRGDSTG